MKSAKIISSILSVAMLVSMFSFGAFATKNTADEIALYTEFPAPDFGAFLGVEAVDVSYFDAKGNITETDNWVAVEYVYDFIGNEIDDERTVTGYHYRRLLLDDFGFESVSYNEGLYCSIEEFCNYEADLFLKYDYDMFDREERIYLTRISDIVEPNEPDEPDEPQIMLGDVNADGKITVVDAKWTLQIVAGSKIPTFEQCDAADVNKSDSITVIDAKWILQAVAGLRVLGDEESHVIKNYSELPAPDLGAYFDIPYIDKVYDYGPEYGDIGNLPPADAPWVNVEYIYRQSDIESVGFVDDYTNLLRTNGFSYLGTTALVGWSYYWENYSNNSVGITIKHYENGDLGVVLYESNYIYQYSDYDIPDFGEIFDVQYLHLSSYSDGSATYNYELSKAKEADPNNEYFNILKENGFALVNQDYYENCGEYVSEWVFENSKAGIRLTVQTDDTYYTIMFDLIANLDRNDW